MSRKRKLEDTTTEKTGTYDDQVVRMWVWCNHPETKEKVLLDCYTLKSLYEMLLEMKLDRHVRGPYVHGFLDELSQKHASVPGFHNTPIDFYWVYHNGSGLSLDRDVTVGRMVRARERDKKW